MTIMTVMTIFCIADKISPAVKNTVICVICVTKGKYGLNGGRPKMVAGISNGVVNATFAVHNGRQCPPLSQICDFELGYRKLPYFELIMSYFRKFAYV
mgnify:CR=1 FL=1